MREIGRGSGGGTLVAATIAALHGRTASDKKLRSLRARVSPLESRTALRDEPPADRPRSAASLESGEGPRHASTHRRRHGRPAPLDALNDSLSGPWNSARIRNSASHSAICPPNRRTGEALAVMSDREYLTEPFEERAAEAAPAGLHPAVRSYMYAAMGADSDSADEDTIKCVAWESRGGEGVRADAADTDSDSTSSSDADDDSDGGDHRVAVAAPRSLDADYRTLTPGERVRPDTSTRCDADFRWLRSGSGGGGDDGAGSVDRRRLRAGTRSERDRKSRSSLSAKPPQHPASARVSPRRRADEPPTPVPNELQRRWNSYEHFRWPEGGAGGGGGGGGGPGGWWPMCWCHAPPPPPCCSRERLPPPPAMPWLPYAGTSHLPCKNDAEERVRRLEGDKESLQLQVQVLSEQISAQQDKLLDLERALSDTRQRLDIAEDSLQKETLARSSLETQKLELLSKLSEARLRAAERGLLERSPPPPAASAAAASVAAHLPHPPPPRTPPANYGRQIERNVHAYSSLPRAAHAPDARAVAFAEKEEVIPARGSPSPSLRGVGSAGGGGAWARLARAGSGGGGGGGGGPWLEGGELTRGGVRATAMPRLQRDHHTYIWQTVNVKEWDAETTCAWLESLSLEAHAAAARAWLQATPDARGVIAAAAPATIEKELALKHPMHRKKIVLALCDLQGGDGDPHLAAAGRLDAAWVLRWTEDAGLAGVRDAAAEAALDGRTLHRLTHAELHHQLRVTTLLHALSVRRGIQVLRENEWSADTMVRRGRERSASEAAAAVAAEGEAAEAAAEDGGSGEVEAAELARWSSHRVMQWLKEIDLAEYAPNLRGAGVHGGLMLYEPRFTAELLAALLNIPASKTLLRRHLTQRFNDLLGREVIQQKRNAEQTLGYQPLTITNKYKVPKKSQFSLKRKKCRDELETSDLVCPLRDDGSDDEHKSGHGRVGCLSAA